MMGNGLTSEVAIRSRSGPVVVAIVVVGLAAVIVMGYRAWAPRRTPEYALAVQAERNWNHPRYPEWTSAYGQLIEEAHANGTLPPAQWQSYAREAPDFRLDLRGPVRRGDPIPVRLNLTTRLGPTARFRIEYRESFQLRGGITVPGRGGVRSCEISHNSYGDTPWIMLHLDEATQAKLADGPQFVRAFVDVSVFDPHENSDRPIAERRIELFEPYSQWPPTQAARGLSYEGAQGETIRKGLTLAGITVGEWSRDSARLKFGPVTAPSSIDVSVLVRAGDREWEVTRRTIFSPGVGGHSMEWSPLELDVEKVDVVIRPAETDQNPFNVIPSDRGKNEIVFRDVPLQRADGTRPPSTGNSVRRPG
jgi:hypothetical protein